jgi:diadenosine tetraphosphate (Ap4A) HIT family hydrolase
MKIFKISLIILLQICFSLFATSNDPSKIWIIDSDILENTLPSGITTKEIISTLEKERIEVNFKKKETLILWEGKTTQVSLSNSPFSLYHLWISIKDKKTLEECSYDELKELYQAIWISKKAISENTNANSFMIFTTEQSRQGKDNSFVGFEIIPIGFDDISIMDAVEKNALNNYVFYNIYPIKKISYSPEIVEKLKASMTSFYPHVQKEKNLETHWTQKITHHKEALHQSLQTIYDTLVKNKALVRGEMPSISDSEEKIHEIQINLDKCAFCNPVVIEKQLVCKWQNINVLLSHKPTSEYGNFLIIPARHQCQWDLTYEEAISSFKAIVALKKYFNETTKLNNWICYIQDGQAVGQTVPHTHIHFYIPPDPLKNAIMTLQHIHNQRPILSYDKMRYECEKAKFSILNILKLEILP